MSESERHLPLEAWHRAHGATLDRWCGSSVPWSYGDGALEHEHLGKAAGLWDRSAWDRLELLGRDRTRYLNGLVTINVAALEPGTGAYGFLTLAKGQILSDVVVLAFEDRFWLELPPGQLSIVEAHLKKYVVTEEVEILPLDEMLPVALLGAEAETEIVALVCRPVLGLEGRFSHLRLSLLGTEVEISRQPLLGLPAFSIWVPASIADLVLDEMMSVAKSLQPVGYEAAEIARVKAGVPRFGADFSSQNLPQEVGCESAVDFEKGCYLGQEVVARLHFRGQVSRQIRPLLVEAKALPEVGTQLLYEGRPAGVLSSVVEAGSGSYLGLAMLQRRAFDEGTRLDLEPAALESAAPGSGGTATVLASEVLVSDGE